MSEPHAAEKVYDRAYFDRWYRSSGAVVHAEAVRRKAALALAAAEHLLARDVRNILDVGCGEGQWRAPLLRARPNARYVGVDPSRYTTNRFGRRRNVLHGGLENLHELRLDGPFDLIICSDVLQYVPAPALQKGLATIAELLRGVAYIEGYTIADDMIGDREGWHHRTARFYRDELARAGLLSCGLYCYIPAGLRHLANELELA